MNKIGAFKKKYGNMGLYPPEQVGKAVLASILYERLQIDALGTERAQQQGTEDLFNAQQRDALTATITTPEEWQCYHNYRQLEEWLKSRSVEAIAMTALASATANAIRVRLCTIAWAEEAEKQLGEAARANIFMHKLDASMFCTDDHIWINSHVERENLQYAINRLHIYNTQVALIAKELKMPELEASYSVDIKGKIGANIEWINGLIERLHSEICANYEDDNGIGSVKRDAFASHLQPYQTEPDEIPAAQLKEAKTQLKGLAIFTYPTGGTTFDRLLRIAIMGTTNP